MFLSRASSLFQVARRVDKNIFQLYFLPNGRRYIFVLRRVEKLRGEGVDIRLNSVHHAKHYFGTSVFRKCPNVAEGNGTSDSEGGGLGVKTRT